MDSLNRFEKVLMLKPCVFIDASVILASGVVGFPSQDSCAKYLAKAYKEYRPFITKPMMGEIFKRLCKIEDINTSYNAFRFIRDLLIERKFCFIPHLTNDWSLNYLKQHCSIIPHDDILHISHVYAVLQNSTLKQQHNVHDVHFATLDSKINNPEVIRKISIRLGIKIINPQTFP